MLTEDEQENLYLMAEFLETVGQLGTALDYLNQLVEHVPDNALFFHRRAHVSSQMKRWDDAIHDSRTAISLAPDNANSYLSLGVNITWKIFESDNPSILGDNPLLMEIMSHYQECIRRDPLNMSAWLNSIETYLFMFKWDDAISYYGMCKPYMSDTDHSLTREWLGALAMSLAGDSFDDGEFSLLNNDGITLPYCSYDIRQVDLTLNGLAQLNYHPERLSRAIDMHKRYLSHFQSTIE